MYSSLFRLLKNRFGKDKEFYAYLRKTLGFVPRKFELYKLAFIHKSASQRVRNGSDTNNERLEYLGDAVLDAIVADYIFTVFPYEDEGFLTKLRAKIVNRTQLDYLADKIEMHRFMQSQVANGRSNHIYGNAFEALIGAAYLDRGYNMTKKFFLYRLLESHIDLNKLVNTETDYKSRIIEWSQKNKKEIDFQIEEKEIEESHTPIFVSTVMIDEEIIGEGSGNSKKEASQKAARQALKNVKQK